MEDDLDRLIDGALSDYSSAEPLAGLEERVLNRVRAAEAARRRRWLWALAAPALAAILIAILARPQPAPVARVAPPPARVETAAPSLPPLTPPAVVRQVASRPAAKIQRPPSPRALPKKDLFPTPSPLTSEERLLMAMAESHPHELLIRPVEEIEIKPIQIAPLRIDGGQ
jgi:hypothetical protein